MGGGSLRCSLLHVAAAKRAWWCNCLCLLIGQHHQRTLCTVGHPLQGQALNGELGVGDTNSTYLAVPTSVAGNLSFSDISLGEKFTCGIAGSKAFCWVSGDGT